MRIPSPANVQLLRAQVILILGALIPTILTTPLGVILLASGESGVIEIVTGVLVLAFAASSVTGFIIGGIFLRKGSELVRMQHDFLSSVSHELRTPMTSMRMFVEALLDDRLTDPEERARCLRILRQEIDRLDGLVGRLIELSRVEANRNPYERVSVPVSDVVDDALAAFDALQVMDGSRLHVEVEPDLAVTGDHDALVQVLVNLLSNAKKYSGTDGEIFVTAKAASEREIELVVRDTGPGIPADEQARVFDKFWRSRDAIAAGISGSGLGLSIVHAIVKGHRGRIELRNPDAGGTAFHVTLRRSKL